jgi:NAD+ kinase
MGRLTTVVLGSGDRNSELVATFETLRPHIAERLDIILEDLHYAQDLRKVKADLAVVLGGDGSILRAAKQMGYYQKPVLAVNLGKLGFMADIHPDQLPEALDQIVAGRYRLIDHLMVRCQVIRDGKPIADQIGLNEVAILGGPPFEIQTIELYVDGDLATSYRCDGLIVSTPIGSTAHNLSAGGPILRKTLDAFVISPISPHTLTVRPVVDRSDRKYEIIASRPNQSTSVVLDGQVLTTLKSTDRVLIERAEPIFQLIEIPGHNYYRTLREKLGWAGSF